MSSFNFQQVKPFGFELEGFRYILQGPDLDGPGFDGPDFDKEPLPEIRTLR